LRRDFLYTSARRASSQFLQQDSQLDQVLVAKEGSTGGDFDENIDASGIGAARQNRLQLPFGVIEINAVLTPVLAIFDQFELAPGQRMERMRYAEMLFRIVITGCD